MNLEMFKNGGFEVRGGETDGTPYFVAKDVALMLGYKNPADAVRRHCIEVVETLPLSTNGGIQNSRVIKESDVRRLIIKSHLPEAQKIEHWFFNEVIPSIRKSSLCASELKIASEEAKLLTRRYQLQKRLNSLFIEDIKMELAEIDMNLSELRQLTA